MRCFVLFCSFCGVFGVCPGCVAVLFCLFCLRLPVSMCAWSMSLDPSALVFSLTASSVFFIPSFTLCGSSISSTPSDSSVSSVSVFCFLRGVFFLFFPLLSPFPFFPFFPGLLFLFCFPFSSDASSEGVPSCFPFSSVSSSECVPSSTRGPNVPPLGACASGEALGRGGVLCGECCLGALVCPLFAICHSCASSRGGASSCAVCVVCRVLSEMSVLSSSSSLLSLILNFSRSSAENMPPDMSFFHILRAVLRAALISLLVCRLPVILARAAGAAFLVVSALGGYTHSPPGANSRSCARRHWTRIPRISVLRK